jgi:hypothetical protein
MPIVDELNLFRQVGWRSFEVYPYGPIAVVYLVSVFAVLVFKPDAIHRKWAFRLSVASFALFLGLPCLADLEAIILAFEQGGAHSFKVLEKRLEAGPFVDLLVQALLVVAVLSLLRALARPTKKAPDSGQSGPTNRAGG